MLKNSTYKVFHTHKKVFWLNEVKSWLLICAFVVAFYFVAQLFSSIPSGNFVIGVVVVFLIKVADLITPYRVSAIRIDMQKDQLRFTLHSFMSGEKEKNYELTQVRSELVQHSWMTMLLSSSSTLKIYPGPKEFFRINSRYGFPTKTLASVDETLRAVNRTATGPSKQIKTR